MTPVLVALFLCALIACIIRHARSRPPKYPPGPLRLPIWGNYLQLLLRDYTFPHKAMAAMAEQNKDPVLGLFLGDVLVVVANDWASVRELFLKSEFQGRPDLFTARVRSFGKLHGIFFTDGDLWAEQRRYSLRQLRDFGFGRRFPKLESAVLEEVQNVVDALRGNMVPADEGVVRSRHALMPDVFYAGFVNSFLEVLCGDRIPRGDYERARALSRGVMLFQRSAEPSGGLLNLSPWVRHIVPDVSGYKDFVQGNQCLMDFIVDRVKEHRATLQDDAMRGFLDMYLAEMEKQRGKHTPYTERQMLLVAMDYMFPSASAMPATLAIAVIFMIHHPDKANKAFNEIEAVVGRSRLPDLDDRVNLPYTEAFLREVMRCETLVPLGLPHRATEDTYFRGYFIPKDTIVLTNLWAANRDTSVYEVPEQFLPERFLDSRTGQLKKKDPSTPFGLGKRLCAGETFARQNMFLFLAGILQNFTFSAPDGGEAPREGDMQPGLIVTPREFWVKISERE